MDAVCLFMRIPGEVVFTVTSFRDLDRSLGG